MVMIWPLVISCAMPRPATISTSVAMIGWMPEHRDQHAVPQAEGGGERQRREDRR